ncbi:DUF4279 domain-containing protein [Brevibacillus parabrevis]|uniref:DUF4279 domain-containing protein n=1 Tax=Brevibacillus parabrevis TaxID=54914 RepID=UPI002E1F692F|nr:DUF4279 domain-containing protein [Brevibacillus parabrevis]
MNKTSVMVEFTLTGDQFNPDLITEKLEIKPNEIYYKGDQVKHRKAVRKETCWSINTGYQESLDVNIQLRDVLEKIWPKKNDLRELQVENNLEIKFCIVIKIEENQTPAIYLDSDIIAFAHEIKAEFDFDLYIYS